MAEIDDLLAKYAPATPAPAEPQQQTAKPDDIDALLAKYSPAPTPAPLTKWDKVKGGLNAVGTLATDALDAASGGFYSKGRNAVSGLVAPEATEAMKANEANFNAAHPILKSTAEGIGYLAPTSEASMLARSAEAATGATAKVLPSLAAKVLTSRPVTGAITGAVASGGTAGAEAIQRGDSVTDSLSQAANAAKWGAGLGAGGGVLASTVEAIGTKLKGAAAERDLKQSVSNIVGTDKANGKAIPSELKKIAKAKGPIRDELSSTEGRNMADVAREDPEEAAKIASNKIRQVTSERLKDYQTIDGASANKGVRAGDLVKHLEDAADRLEDKGNASLKPEVNELREAAKTIKNAGEWGAKRPEPVTAKTIDPNTLFNDDYTVGQYRDLMNKAGQGAQAEADIAAKFPPEKLKKLKLDSTGRAAKVFDPDTIVPTLKLREFVTSMQSAAYDNLGTINATNAFKRAQDIAHVGEEFLNNHLNAVEKANPGTSEAVTRLREMNRRVNALATMRDVLKGRIDSQSTAALKHNPTADIEAGLGTAAAVMTGGHSIPATALGMGVKAAAPGILRRIDQGVTRSIASTTPGSVQAPPARLVAPVVANALKPTPDQQLTELIKRASSGDANAQIKLATLSKAPVVSSRIQALRRQLGMH